MPFRTEASLTHPLPKSPSWPALRGVLRVSQWLVRASVFVVRTSPFWAPRLFAVTMAPLYLLLFGLRYAGGAYDGVEAKVGMLPWQNPRNEENARIGPVDLAAIVWRRMAARRWGELEEGELSLFFLALGLWIYSIAWVVVAVCFLV